MKVEDILRNLNFYKDSLERSFEFYFEKKVFPNWIKSYLCRPKLNQKFTRACLNQIQLFYAYRLKSKSKATYTGLNWIKNLRILMAWIESNTYIHTGLNQNRNNEYRLKPNQKLTHTGLNWIKNLHKPAWTETKIMHTGLFHIIR